MLARFIVIFLAALASILGCALPAIATQVDPEGEAAAAALKASAEPSARIVYSLCVADTPECATILRSSFNRIMALPHGLNHPAVAICEHGGYGLGVKTPDGRIVPTAELSDAQLRATFLQMAERNRQWDVPIDYYEAYVLTFALPCFKTS